MLVRVHARWVVVLVLLGQVLELRARAPEADPDDVMARLAEEAARRAIADLDATARQSADPMGFADDVGWLKLPTFDWPSETTMIAWM